MSRYVPVALPAGQALGDRDERYSPPPPTAEPPPLRDDRDRVDGHQLVATIGFDPDGHPAEIFLSGGKTGSALDSILGDAAIVISVALQHGIPALALCKSVARFPARLDGPATVPASPIGAALDLVVRYQQDKR
jgi:hypothetical protein